VHFIYASAATRHCDTADLTKLLDAARKHNDAAGLTGILLYTDGSFFQVLEGVPDAVEALYARIIVDKRHEQVTKIVAEAIPSRSFANWTMGFSQVSRKDLALISGTNDFFNGSSCFLGLNSGRAKKLLSAFRGDAGARLWLERRRPLLYEQCGIRAAAERGPSGTNCVSQFGACLLVRVSTHCRHRCAESDFLRSADPRSRQRTGLPGIGAGTG
jgi:hypothetical protein